MTRAHMLAWCAAAALLGATSLQIAHTARAADSPDSERPYTIENGHIDRATFRGYLYYGDACLRCHGPDGSGSSYAPSLVDSLKRLSKQTFEETVINGRMNVGTANDKVMPSFGTNADVVEHLEEIYSYLKARSDGAIGRGRPKKIGETDD